MEEGKETHKTCRPPKLPSKAFAASCDTNSAYCSVCFLSKVVRMGASGKQQPAVLGSKNGFLSISSLFLEHFLLWLCKAHKLLIAHRALEKGTNCTLSVSGPVSVHNHDANHLNLEATGTLLMPSALHQHCSVRFTISPSSPHPDGF